MDAYTGLPTVTKDQVVSFFRDLRLRFKEEGAVDYVNKSLERIEASNPELLKYILFAIDNAPGENKLDTALNMCVVHGLLYRQAEAASLEELASIPTQVKI